MTIRLNGKRILELSGCENVHQLALRSRVSYPTMLKYISQPEKIDFIQLSKVETILRDGCNMTTEQIRELLGDAFEVI